MDTYSPTKIFAIFSVVTNEIIAIFNISDNCQDDDSRRRDVIACYCTMIINKMKQNMQYYTKIEAK